MTSSGPPATESLRAPHSRPASALFHRPLPRPDAGLRLVCLPHAGGGASVFRGWAARLPEHVELVTLRLPGRENRIHERPYTTWPMLVRAVSQALAQQVRPPYVLFGHSLGGMLGYELTTRPYDADPAGVPGASLDWHPPERLILAGCRAPDAPAPQAGAQDRAGGRIAAELAGLAGSPPEVLANRALLATLEPMLRADLALAERWPELQPLPLSVPLTTFDAGDDVMAPPESVAGWERYALRGLRAHHLTGSHFGLHEHPEAFLSVLRDEVSAVPLYRTTVRTPTR